MCCVQCRDPYLVLTHKCLILCPGMADISWSLELSCLSAGLSDRPTDTIAPCGTPPHDLTCSRGEQQSKSLIPKQRMNAFSWKLGSNNEYYLPAGTEVASRPESTWNWYLLHVAELFLNEQLYKSWQLLSRHQGQRGIRGLSEDGSAALHNINMML